MNKPYALIVDDEPDIRELLAMTLKRMDIASETAADLQQAKKLLSTKNYFLCLADMRLPDGDGIELVEHIQQHYSSLPVAVITAYGNVDGAVNTLKAGAFDYVSKPINLAMLRDLVNTALRLREEPGKVDQQTSLLGESPAIKDLQSIINKLSRSQAPVLIAGESGTGKELVAKQIHDCSPRNNKAFVPVNCGAIPNELMESEFFGHKKGSFTGATVDKKGLFQVANGGTLFLDEIADLPLVMQVKLLRAIQEKAIRPVGAEREVSVDVRIISATHKDLPAMVADGSFRQDLFYRVNVISVNTPALRDCKGDIPLLAKHFIKCYAEQQTMPPPELEDAAIKALSQYCFPGNVRELENIIERALTLCDANVITPHDLQLNSDPQRAPAAVPTPEDLDQFLETQEHDKIMTALEKNKWNRTATAKALGISFRALRYRMQKMKIK